MCSNSNFSIIDLGLSWKDEININIDNKVDEGSKDGYNLNIDERDSI